MLQYQCMGCKKIETISPKTPSEWPSDSKQWCAVTGKREIMSPLVPDFAMPGRNSH